MQFSNCPFLSFFPVEPSGRPKALFPKHDFVRKELPGEWGFILFSMTKEKLGLGRPGLNSYTGEKESAP